VLIRRKRNHDLNQELRSYSDLAAESGRAVLGRFDGARLRWKRSIVSLMDLCACWISLYWDTLRLFAEIKQGLAKTINQAPDLACLGLDTWELTWRCWIGVENCWQSLSLPR